MQRLPQTPHVSAHLIKRRRHHDVPYRNARQKTKTPRALIRNQDSLLNLWPDIHILVCLQDDSGPTSPRLDKGEGDGAE